MKRIILVLAYLVFNTALHAQLINNQPLETQVCQGADATITLAASGTALQYQWEVQITKYGVSWTGLNAFSIGVLKSLAGFEDIDITGYNSNSLKITKCKNGFDSIQLRCQVVQPMPAVTQQSNAVYLIVNALPSIDRSQSVLKGCEPTDISLRMNSLYTPKDLTSCKYDLKNDTKTITSIDNNDPGTILANFPISVDTSGKYYLEVQSRDNISCKRTDTVDVTIQQVFQQEEIGLVTYDPTFKRFKLVWNVTKDKGTDSCVVYAAPLQLKANVIGKIAPSDISGKVHVNYGGTFIDQVCDPAIETAQFAMTLIDSCGHVSGMSKIHIPISVKQSIDSIKNVVALSWNDYIGITYSKFYIHRHHNIDSVHLRKYIIDTIDNNIDTMNFWTDAKPVDNSYYAISIDLPSIYELKSSLKAESGPYSQSLSNITEYKTASALQSTSDIPLVVYPNPFKDQLYIGFELGKNEKVSIDIIDVMGSSVFSQQLGMLNAGKYEKIVSLPVLASGVYYLRFTSGDQVTSTKLIQSKF